MDPGIVWFISGTVAIPFILITLMSEYIRLTHFQGRPLATLSALTLGIIAVFPSTFSLLAIEVFHGWLPTFIATTIFLIVFYTVRTLLLRSSEVDKKKITGVRSNIPTFLVRFYPWINLRFPA